MSAGYDFIGPPAILESYRQACTFVEHRQHYSITGAPYSAAYDYLANNPLVSQITFKSNAVTRMTTTKQFDFLNRLRQISSAPSASSAVSFTYSYNNANQRTQIQLGDGSYWKFAYDWLGQVTSGHKYFADETPVAGQQFDYAFDTIGNRTQAKAGIQQGLTNGWPIITPIC